MSGLSRCRPDLEAPLGGSGITLAMSGASTRELMGRMGRVDARPARPAAFRSRPKDARTVTLADVAVAVDIVTGGLHRGPPW
jgi:hypothetical protein